MLKVLILYFSGTGNTHYIANYIYSHLNSKITSSDIIISIESIEVFNIQDIINYHIVCFGFPVFELNCPKYVENYLKNVPNDNQKGLFLFSTQGFAAGNAFRKVFKYFGSKDYIFLGSCTLTMPGTDGLMMMNEKSNYVQKALQKDYDNLPKLDNFIEGIKNLIQKLEQKQSDTDFRQYKAKLPLSISDSLFGWIFHLIYLIAVRYMKKRFRTDDRCNKCGICVEICPTKNISLEDQILFADKCTVCLRCIHQCPQKAIQIGKLSVGKYRWQGPKGKFNPLKILKQNK